MSVSEVCIAKSMFPLILTSLDAIQVNCGPTKNLGLLPTARVDMLHEPRTCSSMSCISNALIEIFGTLITTPDQIALPGTRSLTVTSH